MYNTDLFDNTTIARLIGHYETLLESIVADADQRISDVQILTDAEHQQLLVDWNNTSSGYPRDRCVHQLFEQQVEQSPDAVAVVYGDQQLTYQEINCRANQLAHYLRTQGIGSDTPVAILVERSCEMVVGWLGILKAGGAYVPMDPSYPEQRLALMLKDSEAPVLLTMESMKDRVPDYRGRILSLDSDTDELEGQPVTNPCVSVSATSLAYVIYTSGSTGKPKGVAIPHRAVNRLVCKTDYLQIEASDRVAQASNASFDAATFEIWGVLLHGAQLVGVAREMTLNPKAFTDFLDRQRITVMFITTALFNQMACEAPGAFSGLRALLFGGEAVDPSWVRHVLSNGPPQRLLHVYGPTETTTFATWYEVKEVPEVVLTVPIGTPIANTQAYILDRDLQPVPIGIPGELYLSGDGLGRGYLNRPELTAEKFIPDTFSEDPAARLYKTGDLARYLPDGTIEFLGRIDHQVKIRGFRIELGEVESVLGRHPAVEEAVVIAREDVPGDKRLVAYVVSSREPTPTFSELRRFLKEKLPDYMIPSAFVELESLPLTPNGKVDRRALPTPDLERSRLETKFVAPHTPVEKVLAKIWSEALGLQRVGVHDNFFELGGHSLLATQVMSRARDNFKMELPLLRFFETPTIAGLTELVETIRLTGLGPRPYRETTTSEREEGEI
jgi:amino acid adenylation domain-containing protein